MLPATHMAVAMVGMGAVAILQQDTSVIDVGVMLFWGVGVDIDHYALDYLRDIPGRIWRGGGYPGKDVKRQVCWLHKWPGAALSILTGIIITLIFPAFWAPLPFVFWVLHMIPDIMQEEEEDDYFSFLYPFTNKRIFPKSWEIVPAKTSQEAFLVAHFLCLEIVALLIIMMLY